MKACICNDPRQDFAAPVGRLTWLRRSYEYRCMHCMRIKAAELTDQGIAVKVTWY